MVLTSITHTFCSHYTKHTASRDQYNIDRCRSQYLMDLWSVTHTLGCDQSQHRLSRGQCNITRSRCQALMDSRLSAYTLSYHHFQHTKPRGQFNLNRPKSQYLMDSSSSAIPLAITRRSRECLEESITLLDLDTKISWMRSGLFVRTMVHTLSTVSGVQCIVARSRHDIFMETGQTIHMLGCHHMQHRVTSISTTSLDLNIRISQT